MIVGTAGHIDHGKSALVRALTGVDPDRLPEEKNRGISIELGYAYRPLADGQVLGFIDVPGHERFIHTMLAGASGIDLALLVVAADDGVMPQTVEHLDILQLLAVTAGAVAITKIDRTDAVRVDQVRAQVERLLAPTRFAGCPIFPVSALTGAGVAALGDYLTAAAVRNESAAAENFRLAVDRCFTLPGIGTVVTGTVFAGTVKLGDELLLSPSGRAARVRGLHVQNRPAASGGRGQRCAIALAGVAREQARRGDWLVTPTLHAPSERFDLRLTLLPGAAKPLRHNAPVHLHLGAAHRTGRIALLEGDLLEPGALMLAQAVVDEPIHCAWGDPCVVRDASASRTLGGGPVLDPHPPARHRRRPDRLAALAALALPTAEAALAALTGALAEGVELAAFARDRNLPEAALRQPPATVRAAGRLFASAAWAALEQRVLETLAAFHRSNADEPGPSAARLRRMAVPQQTAAVAEALFDGLIATGGLARSGPWLHLPEHRATLAPADEALAARLCAPLAAAAEPMWVRDLAERGACPEPDARRLLLSLMRRGDLAQIVRDLYATPAQLAIYAGIVLDLDRSEGRASAARFRDRSGLGRKRAIQVLEFFDRVGYTRRIGAAHRLRADADPAWFAAGGRP